MRSQTQIAADDCTLIQILDAAMEEAARRSDGWLACRLGCTDCCLGPFPITQLDAQRLRAGLVDLAARDPERASRVRERACDAVARFDDLDDDEPCPALDPETGACDLYEARPVTCRIFGPAVRAGGDAVGTCDLCYQGASEAEIAACAVTADPDGLEDALVADLEETTGRRGQTIVAFALVAP